MTIQNASLTIETIAKFYGNSHEKRETTNRWVTCCPIHGDNNPSLALELDTSKRLGFSYVCRSRNCDGSLIMKRFVDDGLIQRDGSWLKKDDRGSLIIPVPLSAPTPPPIKAGSSRYQYLNKLGQTLIYVDRIPKDNGQKEFRPLCLYTKKSNPTELGWSTNFPQNFKDKPLYGLERFEHDKPFLLCEGEKKVDKAAVIFGNAFVPISYQGGVNAFASTDWSEIPEGSKIVIWPDNDEAARQVITKADGLVDFLIARKYSVSIVPVWEYNLPNKWDLADPLPESWTYDKIKELAANAKPLIYFRKSALNQLCALSQIIGDAAATHDCKNSTEIECEFCQFKGRFDSPSQIAGLDPIHRNVILVTEQTAYYDGTNGSILSEKGLTMKYAYTLGYSVSGNTKPAAVLESSDIVTRVDNYISWPGRGLLIAHEHKRFVNIWKPWDIRDYSKTRPQIWLDLAAHIFPDPDVYAVILDWLAHTIQFPLTKINYGLLIISPIQGIGKSLLVEAVKRLLGASAKSIDMTTFGTQYTSYLEGIKLLIIEELASTGHLKSNYNKLKTMVSAPPDEIEINKKFVNSYKIPNLVNVIAFSNKEVPIIMEEHDRRWMVYRTEVHPKHQDFYTTYAQYIKSNEGLDSLYWFLMERDLSNFNASRAPELTDAKHDLIHLSREGIVADLYEQDEQHLYPFNSHLVTELDIKNFAFNQLRQTLSGVQARSYLKAVGYVRVKRMQINVPGKEVDQRVVWCKPEYFDIFNNMTPAPLAKYYLTKDRSKLPMLNLI